MDPALYNAATQGDVARLQQLASSDPTILSSRTPQLNTAALHLAVLHGHATFARQVLHRNRELVIAKHIDGNTPRHLAAKAGKAKVVEVRSRQHLENPSTADTPPTDTLFMTNKAGGTPLHDSRCSSRRHGTYTNADLTSKQYLRMNPSLYKAATHGRVSSLKQLVENDPTALSATTLQLNTALDLAAAYGHAGCAGEVLEKIEGLLVARNDDGDTPLHLAAKAGKLEVAELLIRYALLLPPEEKSPLFMTNKAGNSPLHEAVRHGKAAVAVALLDADLLCGHDLKCIWPPARDWSTLSGRSSTSPGSSRRVVEILLEKRPELIDLTDSDGNNALHYAAQKNDHRAVKMLLNTRTELAYKRNQKNMFSPLHVAVHYGSTDAIKALLRHCPDVVEMVDGNGRNALHTAVTSDKTDALRVLLRHVRFAEITNRVDHNGNTPLHLAAQMSRVQSALLLLGDRRVDPCVVRHDGLTARGIIEIKLHSRQMDAYEMYLWEELIKQEEWSARVPPSADLTSRRMFNDKYFERVIGTYILVATVIATAAFAATFTMPGGYDQTKGIALHGHNAAFKIFVVSNGVAMCSSIVLIFCMIWVWQSPDMFRINQLLWGHRLTVLAVLAMLVSFMTAVYITVAPTQRWPAYVVIAMGAISPVLVILIVGREVFTTRVIIRQHVPAARGRYYFTSGLSMV
ncbi:hypothetical protein PR202_ga13372 [Eleusine coracana subsp. coracana]|uniref:PGG domain-containing protein n=1 Tax=Eleusine coracana subsp. coracana TaxID=191504 RepID=A0AAV5CEJ4_ELECO|nr:hypothetical protein PR202_ga13372 [Eleusine coracana subsp. coracana]